MKRFLLALTIILLPFTALAETEEVDLEGLSEQQIIELKEKAADMRGDNTISDPVKQAEIDSTYVITAIKTMADELGYETTEDFLHSETGQTMWTLFWTYHAHEAGFNLLGAVVLVVVGLPVWLYLFNSMCVQKNKFVTKHTDGSKTTEYRYFMPNEVTDSRAAMLIIGLVGFSIIIILIITA